MTDARSSWRQRAGAPSIQTFVALLAVYALTLAPDVTLWDAGEFQSAVASLGVPHPPGTPLYVLIGRVWTMALPDTWLAVAMNALSAVATASAGALVAHLFNRWTRSPAMALAAGLSSGLTFSVWQSATETEVYAVSLLLGVVLIAVGEHGDMGTGRRSSLIAYLLGVAGPLHLDVLLAAPAAVLLISAPPGDRLVGVRRLLRWAAPLLAAVGLGRGSVSMLVAAVGAAIAYVLLPLPGRRGERALAAGGDLALVALGASGVLFLLFRSAHDPGINQGDPSTWARLIEVITRAQYDVPGLWPRRAPLWLQIGNVFQYFEWQFAFGLDDRTTLSFVRTPIALVFAGLAWIGARAHWKQDARGARAWLVYILVAGFGAMLVLNLEAGPSIGWGILPDGAGHEARERDYFFAAAFAAVAAWSGVGACELWRRASGWRPRVVAWVVPVVLLATNWRATDRRREPDASIPRRLADALLTSAPPNAVMLVAGDNDTYTVWQAQHVRRERVDVIPVTLPLLGADWYRQELRRRYALLASDEVTRWTGLDQTIAALHRGAARTGRPFTVSMAVPRDLRNAVGTRWRVRGLLYVLDSAAVESLSVDSSTQRVARAYGLNRVRGRDPTTRYVERLLACPGVAAARAAKGGLGRTDSLDSVCNF